MSMQPCLLSYDIPDSANIENPSNRLRRIAVRIELSCWVIREGDVPYNYLQYLKDNGATWHVIRFDMGENEKLVKKVKDAIAKDIRESITRAKKSAENANKNLNDVNELPSDRRKKYDSTTKATVKRLRRTLTDLRSAAGLFGIKDSEISLSDAMRQTRAIEASMHRRAEVWQQAINALQSRVGASNGMVRSAKADNVPHGIFADYLDDQGENGQTIRDMFQ